MHFKSCQAPCNIGYKDEDNSVRLSLCSRSKAIEDWVMDSNLFDIKSSFKGNLSIYLMGQLWVTPKRTKLLLLVSVDDDFELFGSKGFAVNSQQQIQKNSSRGRIYYPLQCTIISSNCNTLINEVKDKTYMEAKFINQLLYS